MFKCAKERTVRAAYFFRLLHPEDCEFNSWFSSYTEPEDSVQLFVTSCPRSLRLNAWNLSLANKWHLPFCFPPVYCFLLSHASTAAIYHPFLGGPLEILGTGSGTTSAFCLWGKETKMALIFLILPVSIWRTFSSALSRFISHANLSGARRHF